MNDEDPRDTELETLFAIYPEIEISDSDPYTFSLDLPVNPVTPVVVTFPALASGPPTTSSNKDNNDNSSNRHAAAGPSKPNQSSGSGGDDIGVGTGVAINGAAGTESHEIFFLPSLQLTMTLPQGYPTENPPSATIATSPSWLPDDVCERLQSMIVKVWEDMSRDLVAFLYIDTVQQDAEKVFGMVDGSGTLELDSSHKLAVLDYDSEARKKEFQKQSYDCGICLEPKKGTICHKMMDCGHIFCVECLQDFYTTAIAGGDLSTIRCLEPNCTKEREKKYMQEQDANAAGGNPQSAKRRQRKRPRMFISPSELLQIPLSTDFVKRYVTLKYKNELESDKNTVYCPRSFCQGAARSKRHKKPEGLELKEASDDEGEDDGVDPEEGMTEEEKKEKELQTFKTDDLLCICDDCGFAFCRRCESSWHGEFKHCVGPRRKGELTAEEIASLEYIKAYTSPCPTCQCPCQKTQGCNHMVCFKCDTHFCYLCSGWLEPQNPYSHYSRKGGCYNRLWELQDGDGDDVREGILGGFVGEVEFAEPDREIRGGRLFLEPQVFERIEIGDGRGNRGAPRLQRQGNGRGGAGGRGGDGGQQQQDEVAEQHEVRPRAVAVERIAPLVLRIDAPPPPPPPARRGEDAPRGRGGRGRGRGRGGNAGRGGRGGARPRMGFVDGARDDDAGEAGHEGRRRREAAPAPDDDEDDEAADHRRRVIGRELARQHERLEREHLQRVAREQQQQQLAGVQGQVDDEQGAWIRNFVRLALMDQEEGN